MEFQCFKIIQDFKNVYMRRYLFGLVYVEKNPQKRRNPLSWIIGNEVHADERRYDNKV